MSMNNDMNMYIVIKHEFDGLENREPWFETIIGYIYCNDTENINTKINKLKEKDSKYKGWDGKTYPYYTYEKIEEIL